MCVLSHFICIWLFVIPWTVAHQIPLSMEFSRQEYWSGKPFLSPQDLLDPGIEPRSPTLQIDSLPSEPPGKPPKIMLPLNMFDSNIEYLHKISQRLPKISCLHPFLSNHHGLSVLSSSTETTINPVYVKLYNCYFLSKCYYLY